MNKVVLIVCLFVAVALIVSGCELETDGSEDPQYSKVRICRGSLSCGSDTGSVVVPCSAGPASNGFCAATCPNGMNRESGHCWDPSSYPKTSIDN